MQLWDKQAAILSPISGSLLGQSLLSGVNYHKIGVVVCDRRLRYKALSQSVAEMHNVPVKGHFGHSFHQILGTFAEKVAPFWENVLSTGQPFTNFEIIGKLPKRSDTARWIENLFPLRDGRGRITQVGCIVIETTPPPIPDSPPSTSARKTSVADNQTAIPDRREVIPLSRREQEVVRLLAEGKSNKEISPLLGISVRTVETYRSRVMLKVQATSIVDLVYYAIRTQIVTL
ncbi:MAG TPA: LuxR C-terminal-related transcriptional regulator [Candidatus Acidoferrales bacterium]|jgi:DNA-binding CsgD family transcriptional regulator|nr:LuxR C-terminal-related transcriptional regulator [Candidatus Acidoferrales bacterium]